MMVKVPLGQQSWSWVEMVEDALLRFLVAPSANVRSCEEVVVAFQCPEGACLKIVS